MSSVKPLCEWNGRKKQKTTSREDQKNVDGNFEMNFRKMEKKFGWKLCLYGNCCNSIFSVCYFSALRLHYLMKYLLNNKMSEYDIGIANEVRKNFWVKLCFPFPHERVFEEYHKEEVTVK